ncbi:hypothetical protein C8F01DRAFT_1167494 [Mycena amicta]|nr:hypothetical protein C8F01DRAFT_1167494 [Mycena amicta]
MAYLWRPITRLSLLLSVQRLPGRHAPCRTIPLNVLGHGSPQPEHLSESIRAWTFESTEASALTFEETSIRTLQPKGKCERRGGRRITVATALRFGARFARRSTCMLRVGPVLCSTSRV